MFTVSTARIGAPGSRAGKQAQEHQSAGLTRNAATGTALVVAGPRREINMARPAAPPRSAAFLAHLIATAERLPQTRMRRQVGSAEAAAAYRAASDGLVKIPARRLKVT